MIRKSLRKIKNPHKRREVRRKLSIRAKIHGDAERPRLCVLKTNKHLGAQVVNDDLGKTLFSVFTYSAEKQEGLKKTVAGAKVLGTLLGKKLKQEKIEKIVVDRNGKKFSGMLASLVEGIREQGISV